jgi:hypothetical protein
MYKGISNAILAVALLAPAASQGSNLVVNGSFSNVNGATSSYAIDISDLPGWSASPSPNKFLDCVIFPGDTTNLCGGTTTNNPSGWVLSFYQKPGPSPDGGNFLGIDGDTNYAVPLTQTLNGLQVGTSYSVFFYQAAAQQSGFNGATTEQWQVSLGSDSQVSTLMNTPDHGSVGWNAQTMTFKATAASEVLKFLALGTPNGQPPFVFLDGVNVQVATPEPSTWALLSIAGLSAWIVLKRRKRRA